MNELKTKEEVNADRDKIKKDIDSTYNDLLELLKYDNWADSYRSKLHKALSKLLEIKNMRL